jgi:uncharacterized protein RhaS with RHS repeats
VRLRCSARCFLMDRVAAVVFLNARYLDPVLGRFISVDPLIDKTRDAYGYGNNNPVTFSDPSGLCSIEDTCEDVQGMTIEDSPRQRGLAQIRSSYQVVVLVACVAGDKDAWHRQHPNVDWYETWLSVAEQVYEKMIEQIV